MTMTTTPTVPRPATGERGEAMRLAQQEYQRFLDLLQGLRPADWSAPTACSGWDVRAVAAHTLGMMEMAASLREQRRQNRAAAARQAERGGLAIDALTGIQVDERAGMTPDQIVSRMAERAPAAARARRRTPWFVRRRRLPVLQQVGDAPEWWTIGYLTDVILTRDPWMHRSDIALATGVQQVLTAEHDGAIVAGVVAEWAARHGKPYRLRLSGPAGGDWQSGGDPQAGGAGTGAAAVIEMDAVEFCRILSGRGQATGLLVTAVPF